MPRGFFTWPSQPEQVPLKSGRDHGGSHSQETTMRTTPWIAAAITGALAAFAAMPAAARTFVDLQVRVPAQVQTVPAAPLHVQHTPTSRRGQVWVPGHWRWNGYRQVWTEGHFVRARDARAMHQPHWVPPAHRWSSRGPHWQRGDRDRDGVPNRIYRDRDGDGVRNRFDRAPDNGRRY